MPETRLASFDSLLQVPLRNGLTKPKRVRGTGIKMVNMGELFAYDRIRSIEMDRVPLEQRERETSLLQPGDLLFARQSLVLEGAGKCSIFLDDHEPVTFESHIIRARLDQRLADPLYVYYYFRSPAGQNSIRSIVEQVAASGIRGRDLANLKVPIPHISHQRAVAHILGTLDDKIELNRQMNETLEEIARALFKSWFVDFDPVRAKSEGRDPGLPPHIADLFPGSFEDSEVGEIPKGWRVTTLGEVCEKPQYGFTASAISEPLGPKFLRITDINKRPWINWSTVPYCEIPSDQLARYRVRYGDILIARMADPGHGVMIEQDLGAVFASYLIRFRPIDALHARYLQYWLRSDSYWELVAARQAGTTRSSLNAKVLQGFQLVVPSDQILGEFSRTVSSLRMRVVAGVNESETLAALRDVLLPKLMSGEVRANEGAWMVKEAEG